MACEEWLYEKFKTYRPLEYELRKIRKSKENSKYRTWNYLYGQLMGYITNLNADANQEDIATNFLKSTRMPAAAGAGRRAKAKAKTKARVTVGNLDVQAKHKTRPR